MSLNPSMPLKLFKVEDPVCRVGSEREYGVIKSGQEIFFYPFPTSGAANTSTNTFNCNPTSQRTIIDRKIYILANFTLTFTGTSTGSQLLYKGFDAPRSYPLSKVTKNIQVQLGDEAITTNLNEYFSAIERYSFDRDLQDHEFSITPTMPDQQQVYAGNNTNLAANNELGGYFDNPAQVPRGFQNVGASLSPNVWCTVVSNTSTQAVVNMTVCEPIFLSPLYFGKGEQSGIIGIQNLQIQQQFGDLTRLWSHSPNSLAVNGANISFPTGLSVAVNSMFCLVKQITPDALYKIPSIIPYPYSQISSFPTGNAISIASGASQTLSSGSITLNSIPTRLYLFARKQNSDLTAESTDTFAELIQCTFQLGTRQLLATATQQDLYEISRRNGCNMSWTQWKQQVGSVLAVDLNKDIGLQPTEAPGLLTRSSLVVTANFKNNNPSTVNYMMYVLVCEEGTITIDNGHVKKSIGVLSAADVLAAENAQQIPYKHDRNIYGGAWYNDLWSGVKDVAKFVKDEALPVAKDIYDVYKTVSGKGVVGGENMSKKMMKEDDYVMDAVKGGKKGKGLVGARMISRYDL